MRGRPDEAASWLKQAETIRLIRDDTELARRLEAARTELTRQREKLAVHERELLEQQARDAQAERVAERARKLFATGQHDEALALLRRAHEHPTIRGVIEELESQLVQIQRQRERQERADRSRERRAAAALVLRKAAVDRRLHVVGAAVISVTIVDRRVAIPVRRRRRKSKRRRRLHRQLLLISPHRERANAGTNQYASEYRPSVGRSRPSPWSAGRSAARSRSLHLGRAEDESSCTRNTGSDGARLRTSQPERKPSDPPTKPIGANPGTQPPRQGPPTTIQPTDKPFVVNLAGADSDSTSAAASAHAVPCRSGCRESRHPAVVGSVRCGLQRLGREAVESDRSELHRYSEQSRTEIARAASIDVSIDVSPDGQAGFLTATQTFSYVWNRSRFPPTGSGTLTWILRKVGGSWTVQSPTSGVPLEHVVKADDWSRLGLESGVVHLEEHGHVQEKRAAQINLSANDAKQNVQIPISGTSPENSLFTGTDDGSGQSRARLGYDIVLECEASNVLECPAVHVEANGHLEVAATLNPSV